MGRAPAWFGGLVEDFPVGAYAPQFRYRAPIP
jgi:hypothetical protein